MNEVKATKNEKQISIQLGAQKRHLQVLWEISATLQERLCPASREQEPQVEAKGASPDQECLVPIAAELRDHNDTIRAATNRLEGMVARLEL